MRSEGDWDEKSEREPSVEVGKRGKMNRDSILQRFHEQSQIKRLELPTHQNPTQEDNDPFSAGTSFLVW